MKCNPFSEQNGLKVYRNSIQLLCLGEKLNYN